MGTAIRPEVSKANKYHISKHRYYELKHFCLQYPEWTDICRDGVLYPQNSQGVKSGKTEWNDPTGESASIREDSIKNIELVKTSANLASDEIGSYILKSVTEGLSYTHLQMMLGIPCSRSMFYDRYRKFFYILNSRKH